jgi:hypothetical protein
VKSIARRRDIHQIQTLTEMIQDDVTVTNQEIEINDHIQNIVIDIAKVAAVEHAKDIQVHHHHLHRNHHVVVEEEVAQVPAVHHQTVPIIDVEEVPVRNLHQNLDHQLPFQSHQMLNVSHKLRFTILNSYVYFHKQFTTQKPSSICMTCMAKILIVRQL